MGFFGGLKDFFSGVGKAIPIVGPLVPGNGGAVQAAGQALGSAAVIAGAGAAGGAELAGQFAAVEAGQFRDSLTPGAPDSQPGVGALSAVPVGVQPVAGDVTVQTGETRVQTGEVRQETSVNVSVPFPETLKLSTPVPIQTAFESLQTVQALAVLEEAKRDDAQNVTLQRLEVEAVEGRAAITRGALLTGAVVAAVLILSNIRRR